MLPMTTGREGGFDEKLNVKRFVQCFPQNECSGRFVLFICEGTHYTIIYERKMLGRAEGMQMWLGGELSNSELAILFASYLLDSPVEIFHRQFNA